MGRPNLTPVFSANFEPEQPQGASMARPGQPTSINDGGAGPININQPSEWTTGLFGCMEDKQNAFITCLLPFNTFGQIAEVVDEGATNCLTSGRFYGTLCTTTLVPCVYSCTFRTKLRSKYGLPEAPCSDWITHCFCECCALCQEYRELKNRGLDPSIGWSGNVQKQRMAKQQEMMEPPMGQRMMG